MVTLFHLITSLSSSIGLEFRVPDQISDWTWLITVNVKDPYTPDLLSKEIKRKQL